MSSNARSRPGCPARARRGCRRRRSYGTLSPVGLERLLRAVHQAGVLGQPAHVPCGVVGVVEVRVGRRSRRSPGRRCSAVGLASSSAWPRRAASGRVRSACRCSGRACRPRAAVSTHSPLVALRVVDLVAGQQREAHRARARRRPARSGWRHERFICRIDASITNGAAAPPAGARRRAARGPRRELDARRRLLVGELEVAQLAEVRERARRFSRPAFAAARSPRSLPGGPGPALGTGTPLPGRRP